MAAHTLASEDFVHLAKGVGGAQVVRQLRAAERSRRLLLLNGLLDAVEGTTPTGPLPQLASAVGLLVRVEHSAPDVFESVLAHPHLGSWMGNTIRLLTGNRTSDYPLWTHLGYLHAVAAAAAIRAGLDFDTAIPVWQGHAVLPTLGLATVAGGGAPIESHTVIRVHGHGGRWWVGQLELPALLSGDGPGWRAIRTVTTRANGQALTIQLDHIDPYRGIGEPWLPDPLPAADTANWEVLLADAWRLIVDCLPDWVEAIEAGLDTVAPRPLVPFRTHSATTADGFGNAIISLPADSATLAATLVHEFQHIRLNGLLHLVSLHESDPEQRLYAPWRDDPRPVGGVLHGVYAFSGVTAFWRALAGRGKPELVGRAAVEFACWRAATWRALTALRADPGLTMRGRQFVDAIAEPLHRWQADPVPDGAAELAERIAADHYAGWRLRHLRPNSEQVMELVAAWSAGRSAPSIEPATDPLPTPESDGDWSSARTYLRRFQLSGGDIAGLEPNRVTGTSAADLAYVDGRLEDAAASYRSDLMQDPDCPDSWVGLGLALIELDERSAAGMLLGRPELVRAVHRELRSVANVPTPVELINWIASGLR